MDWPVPLPAIGDKIGDRFRLVFGRGAGPNGVVFKALDLALDLPVAVKFFHPDLFTSPLRDLNQLRLYRARTYQDPNLVRIFEVQDDLGLRFVTSQLMEGLSLRAVLDLHDESGEHFPVPKIRSLADRLLQAVVPIHRAGAIHGNLKPENFFVLPDRLAASDPHYLVFRTLSEGEAIPVTDYYRGPEQLTDPRLELKQIDVYALALILGEIVAISPVKPGMPLSSQVARLTTRLDDLFLKATAADPFARFETLDAFGEEMDKALARVEAEGLWVRRIHETGSFRALRIVKGADGQPVVSPVMSGAEGAAESAAEPETPWAPESVSSPDLEATTGFGPSTEPDAEETMELPPEAVESGPDSDYVPVVDEPTASTPEGEDIEGIEVAPDGVEDSDLEGIEVVSDGARDSDLERIGLVSGAEPPSPPEADGGTLEVESVLGEETGPSDGIARMAPLERVHGADDVPRGKRGKKARQAARRAARDGASKDRQDDAEPSGGTPDEDALPDLPPMLAVPPAGTTGRKLPPPPMRPADSDTVTFRTPKKKSGSAAQFLLLLGLVALVLGGVVALYLKSRVPAPDASPPTSATLSSAESAPGTPGKAVAPAPTPAATAGKGPEAEAPPPAEPEAAVATAGEPVPAPPGEEASAAPPTGEPLAPEPAPGPETASAAEAAPAPEPEPAPEEAEPPVPALFSDRLSCPEGMALIVTDREAPADSKKKPSAVGFCIDRHEFPGAGEPPMTGQSQSRAAARCKKIGKALCTGAQWVRACESSPPPADKCNVSGRLQETGVATECVTAEGVFDLIGNVGEWASDGRLHGGDTAVGGAGACGYSTKRFSPRPTDGFRCCAQPKLD